MAQNDVWRMSCVGSHLGSELAVITFHMREISGVAETATACGLLVTHILDGLKASVTNQFRWDRINCLTVNTTPKVSVEYTTSMPITGTAAGVDELPHQVAQVVTLKTAYAGRSYRGRVFLPGFTETAVTTAQYSAGHTTTVQTAFNNLLAVVGSAGSSTDWRLVIWSEKLQAANNVTSAVARTNPGIIRRRRIGVGQ